MQNRSVMRCVRRLSFCILHSAFCVSLLVLPGCTLIGAIGSKVAPPVSIPAAYKGMQNQSAAIMVWAPEGTMIDFPDVRLDVAGSLQKKLEVAGKAKQKELAGLTFPTSAAAVVRFQDAHPEVESQPVTDVAAKLGVSRVIYVEIENLQTRSDAAVELYRGSATATLKVVEVPAGGGSGTVAYEESAVAAVYPPNAREEGRPDGNDFVFYRGTVDALTTELAKRFFQHEEER
jgi:hypothetical protein